MSLSGGSLRGLSAPWRNNSLMFGGGRDPPLSDHGETVIGVYLLLLGWLSWFGNSLVLFVLCRQKGALQPTDYLTFNLAVSDASVSVFGYSRGIIEIFNVFQDSGFMITSIWTCQVDGFFTLVFGLSSINTLTVISITRYIKGCHQSKARHISRFSVSLCLVLIWTTAGFWSAAPLLGWGSFTDRGYGTCEIDWAKASSSSVHRSYIVSVLVSCFFVPVLIMFFCYVSLHLSDRQRKMERDVTIVSIVICTAFILAWSPYAVVSMWSSCGFHVPNLTSVFTRLFAKSASFYNPLIYFGLSSRFRKDVLVLLPCERRVKNSVRLKRVNARGGLATGGGARLKVPLNQSERKHSSEDRPKPPPTSDGTVQTPPLTPPQVFFMDVPQASELLSEYECERL